MKDPTIPALGCLGALALVGVFSLSVAAHEPFKGPLDPVSTAFRAAADKVVTAPTGTDISKLLHQTVAPALTDRATQHRKRRNTQLATWHTHTHSGEPGLPQTGEGLKEDETALTGDGIPSEINFSGPKKTTPKLAAPLRGSK